MKRQKPKLDGKLWEKEGVKRWRAKRRARAPTHDALVTTTTIMPLRECIQRELTKRQNFKSQLLDCKCIAASRVPVSLFFLSFFLSFFLPSFLPSFILRLFQHSCFHGPAVSKPRGLLSSVFFPHFYSLSFFLLCLSTTFYLFSFYYFFFFLFSKSAQHTRTHCLMFVDT